MGKPLNVLIVEDSEDDALLVVRELRKGGHEPSFERVDTPEALQSSLAEKRWDIVLSDYSMPQFNGRDALRITREKFPDLPFIIVTGAIGEELAAILMREGANDFVMKNHLARLIPAIERELQEAEVRLERKRAQEEIREINTRLHTLIHAIPSAVYFKDSAGRNLVLNKMAGELIGVKPEDVMGKLDEEFLPPELAEKCRKSDEEAISTRKPIHAEEVFTNKEGEKLVLETIKSPLFDDIGNYVGLVGLSYDITEHKEAEEKIRRAKKEWERCFDASTDVIMLLDRQMRALRANQAACDLCETTNHKDLLGNFCYEVFHQASEPCQGCPVAESLTDGKPHTAEIEYQNQGKIFSSTASPLIDDRGELYGVVLFAKDITETRKLESHLRQAQKMEAIGTLAGGIAHDFNNILTAILGYANIVQENLAEGSQDRADQSEVIKAGNRATELVKQILSFSRHAEHDMALVAIQPIIKEALKLLRSTIPTTIEIRQDIASDCCHIMADPTQIHQVLMNLCTNAYHAMREKGGVLSVLLQGTEIAPGDHLAELGLPPGSYVKLEVSDTGHGMDQAVMEKIFEPYFTTKGKGAGTGLGLSVVHGIVKSHGGEIRVYSEPGQGTTFNIYLPCLKGEAVPLAEELSGPVQGGSERILYVDDEESIVKLQERLLTRLGYQVIACTSSSEALQTFRSQPQDIDLVITDMNMPEMNGMELASAILAIKSGQPIILCTGFNEIISKDKLKGIGIREFFMKPSSKRETAAIIRKVLDED